MEVVGGSQFLGFRGCAVDMAFFVGLVDVVLVAVAVMLVAVTLVSSSNLRFNLVHSVFSFAIS